MAVRLGDHAWRQLLDAHHTLVRKELGRFRGREIKTVGDARSLQLSTDQPARLAVLAVFAIILRNSVSRFAPVCIREKSNWAKMILPVLPYISLHV